MTIEEYFLGSKSSDVLVETYEISHPDFTKTHFIVKNKTDGAIVTLEDGTEQEFDYYPMQTTRIATSEDLDNSVQINIGDQGEIMAAEIDAIREAMSMDIKPVLTYRGYSSSDYTQILEGPIKLKITDTVRTHEGAAMEASPRKLNTLRTGETYSLVRFPFLRGFL